MLGGSNGSDLLRNGEEKDDVWVLNISIDDEDKGGAPRVSWVRPQLPRPVPWSFPMVRSGGGKGL